jgi:hypothetical protein
MARLESMANWFFVCLGIVLLGAGILVVPSNAFADAGGDCITSNKCSGETGFLLGACVGSCCAGSSDSQCCTEACTINGVLDKSCADECAAFVTCNSTDPNCAGNFAPCTCPDSPRIWCPSMQRDCGCKWLPVSGTEKCVCINVTGN